MVQTSFSTSSSSLCYGNEGQEIAAHLIPLVGLLFYWSVRPTSNNTKKKLDMFGFVKSCIASTPNILTSPFKKIPSTVCHHASSGIQQKILKLSVELRQACTCFALHASILYPSTFAEQPRRGSLSLKWHVMDQKSDFLKPIKQN